MNEHLDDLAPPLLWQHFRTFCNTPRPSWHEDAILARIEAWADDRGLTHTRDAAGNLRIVKPASAGHESAPGIVLQGHVDMVAEADAAVSHDFTQDPIDTFVENGWLKARGTTLGADNGIGAAAALAILDEEQLVHGPLEVLLTVAEEVSLVGARELAPNWLDGRLLLNLDTEEDGEVCIGCAGGANVTTETVLSQTPIAADETVLAIGVHGLTGGHSGMDIATGRANANRLLARVLHALGPHEPRLVDYDGGRMDNAITRTAWARVALPDSAFDEVTATLVELEATFRSELAHVDEQVTIGQERAAADVALSATDTKRLVDLLYALPYGVERMSLAAPGVVETSNNLGVIQLQNGVFSAQIMVRSLIDSARDAHVERIATMFELAGFPAERGHGYPGWAPNPQSDLLARFVSLHERVTGASPDIKVIHAGLECGLIGAKYPAMDMISFGPTIRGAHSPTERVDIAAVATFYDLLKATIADLAGASAH
ncbi:beta-Ala-His dipeptidase [Salinisphaera sp. Q1T1-3]|uniref:beta-Ala-His dipeptidase n=1 Tax=Salinisphaera sp. Q1T1-3 TaxID=2321229 RepID=UPI000E71B9D9|nr:beta-Ala-His dipeptidase [Salinisphaera sp. Q1T1-3]RJS91612.1 aminoacyl-histidine dipeptidase [Salinisphaera sp. Q1T1-3]